MLKGFIEVAASNRVAFANTLENDLVVFTTSNNQKLLIGTGRNSNVPASITITSNLVDIGGNLNFTGALTQNNAPFQTSRWSSNALGIFTTTSNVGIGTNTLGSKLNVLGEVFVGDPAFKTSTSGTTTAKTNLLVFDNHHDTVTTAGSCTPANKVRIHTGVNNNWIAGFGISSGALNYHSGGAHAFWTQTTSATTYGTERMRILENGNLGIGTASPTSPLHITANSSVSPDQNGLYVFNPVNSANQHAFVTIRTAGSGGGSPILSFDIATTMGWSMGIDNADADKFKIATSWSSLASSTRMTIDSSGNVGIGTASPAHLLDVNGNLRITGHMYMNNVSVLYAKNNSGTDEAFFWPRWSDNNTYINYGSGGFNIRNNSSTVIVYMTNGGNVGIGTTSPGHLLDVNGNLQVRGTLHLSSATSIRQTTSTWTGDAGAGFGKLEYHSNRWYINAGSDSTELLRIRRGSQDKAWIDNEGGFINNHALLAANDAQYGNWKISGNATNGWNGIRFTQAEISLMAGNGSSRESGFHYNGIGWALQIDGSRNVKAHTDLWVNGNLGVGTTSPSHKCHVSGNLMANEIYANNWFRNYGHHGLYNEDYKCHFYPNDAQYGNWRIHGNAQNAWNGLRFTDTEISLMMGTNNATRACGFHYNNTYNGGPSGWALYIDTNKNTTIYGNLTCNGTITGNGSGITNLDASKITSGTLNLVGGTYVDYWVGYSVSRNQFITMPDGGGTARIEGSHGDLIIKNSKGLTINFDRGGTVLFTNGTWSASSDDRIKTDEIHITKATETLLKLRPQKYTKWNTLYYKTDSNAISYIESGLIAQDVFYDTPELRHLVQIPHDANSNAVYSKQFERIENPTIDPDYSEWGNTMATLNYTGLIPYIIKSIQELNEKITALTVLGH